MRAAALLAVLVAATPPPATTPVPPSVAMPILGQNVYTPSGSLVGRIVDVLVDGAGQPEAAVLDVGGFLGIGNRVIAVHWGMIHVNPADHDHPITVTMPAEEIKAAPQYTEPGSTAQVVVRRAPDASPAPEAAPAAPAPAAPPPAAPPPAAPAPAVPAPPAAKP